MQGEIRKCLGIPVITVESSEERHQEIYCQQSQNALTRFLKNASTSMVSDSTIGSLPRRNSGAATMI
jgi:hypothetical protein